MSTDFTLSISTVTATIHAPIGQVNISDWILHLSDAEYQRCSTAHIAAGSTTTDDGRPMSINVETIGDAFVVQHYVAEVLNPHFCRMVSISDSISPAGQTKLQVVWELTARKIDDQSCEYTNHIHSSALEQTLAFLKERHIPFEKARAARQQASPHTIWKRRLSLRRASSKRQTNKLQRKNHFDWRRKNEGTVHHQ